MKNILATAFASLALLSGQALAADMAVKAPMIPPPVYSWTGCNLNVGVGYGMWNQDQYTETVPGLVQTSFGSTTDGGRGWTGRFGAGCDYQLTGTLSNWVVGVLGDYDVMSIKGTNNFQNIGFGGAFGPPSSAPEKESSAWYIGARVGYLVTPTLLTYVDGGYTQTHFGQQNFTFLNNGVAANAFLPGTTYNGWFIGSGVDYALSLSWLPIQGLIWRNEYRFASYNQKDLALLGVGAGPGFGQHATPYVQTATTSLVWHFGMPH